MPNDWISIGALWVNEGGKFGLSFSEDHITSLLTLSKLGSRVKIFKNDYKKEANQPDYKLFIHRDELVKLGISQDNEARAATGYENSPPDEAGNFTREVPPAETPAKDDELPF